MLQNMLMTTLTPLNNKSELDSWENRPFTTVWPENRQYKVKDSRKTIKKKPKRVRTAFSTEQLRTLESTYCRQKYIGTDMRSDLAKSLNIGEKCIKIWFQNRRMKEKRDLSESSCESSCESHSTETPLVSPSPPLASPEPPKTEYLNHYYQSHNSEYSYQLPAYYGISGIPHNMYGIQSRDAFTSHGDGNAYPRHYSSVDMNNANTTNNSLNNYYGNEVNQYWFSDQNSYYTPN